jgi:predicted phosphodiesterase
MRFAAIADIHGNSAALRAVLADVARMGISEIVNLGDALSGPLDPAGTADLLIPMNLPTVSGNHDQWLVDRPFDEMGMWEQWTIPELSDRHLCWVRDFPKTLEWNGVFLCHATPSDNAENWLDRRGDGQLVSATGARVQERLGAVGAPLVLCGHTHIPRVVRVGSTLIANPGSVGCPAYLDTRSTPAFVGETGAPDARYGIFEYVDGGWQTQLCTVPYDPAPMIELALGKGAESWGTALKSGWFSSER